MDEITVLQARKISIQKGDSFLREMSSLGDSQSTVCESILPTPRFFHSSFDALQNLLGAQGVYISTLLLPRTYLYISVFSQPYKLV